MEVLTRPPAERLSYTCVVHQPSRGGRFLAEVNHSCARWNLNTVSRTNFSDSFTSISTT